MSDTNSRTSPRRILNILEEVLLDPDNFTAKKISHKLEIPLATVYRHIETLCDERFLIAGGNKKYIPGPKIRNIILNSLPYEPNLVEYYNYNHKFLWDRMNHKSLNKTKLFEKIELKWYSLSDMKKHRLEFRSFYQEIVDKFIEKEKEIKKFLHQSKRENNL